MLLIHQFDSSNGVGFRYRKTFFISNKDHIMFFGKEVYPNSEKEFLNKLNSRPTWITFRLELHD